MNTTYQDIIRSFVDKYGLSRGQVIAEIEKTFSSMLSQWHRQNVVAMFSDDQLMALGYHEITGVVEQKPIELTTMRGWNTIKRILDKNLSKAACLQDVARYKRKEKEMRWGEIIRQNSGGFYVELEIETGKPVIAVCAGNHIGVHERDKFKVGEQRAFHLRRVEPVMVNDTPRITVVVDRVSKTLVENLLTSQLGNRQVNVRCLNRYVGRRYSSDKVVSPALSLHIDEAQSVLYHGIEDLFAKAGGAGVYIHGYCQSISQLYAEIGMDRANTILDNCNTKLFMRVPDAKTANYVSGHLGEKRTYSPIISLGGGLSIRETEDARIKHTDVLNMDVRQFFMTTYSGVYQGVTTDVSDATVKVVFPEVST